jgi:hypothetical protein
MTSAGDMLTPGMQQAALAFLADQSADWWAAPAAYSAAVTAAAIAAEVATAEGVVVPKVAETATTATE